jgi:hypothetical protein
MHKEFIAMESMFARKIAAEGKVLYEQNNCFETLSLIIMN